MKECIGRCANVQTIGKIAVAYSSSNKDLQRLIHKGSSEMGQDLSNNPNRYIIFSVFFTARAYYPVLAILFIDLGLTLNQFVLLNFIWAVTIFLFEVPSGALADTIGRRKLLITASVLMVIEMLCLLLAPRNGGMILFSLCVINRICSGLSEACASGADEALAYDSLAKDGRADAWAEFIY